MRYVVQADCTGLGWMDHKLCPDQESAETAETALRAGPSAFIGGQVGRTRVVPEDEAQCQYEPEEVTT